jgi:hypothetical protein
MAINIPIITEYVGTGIDKAVREIKQLETAGEKAQIAISKAAVPAAAALAGLGAAGLDFAKAAAEDQAAAEQLAKQLKNSTGASDKQIASIEKFITKTSIASATADDQLRPALANLVRATSDAERGQKLLNTALDISAATGKDVESVSIALAKAENGQYTALKKLGVPMGANAIAQQDMAKFGKQLQKVQREYTAAIEDTTVSEKDRQKLQQKVVEAQEKLNSVTITGADYVKDLDKAFGGAAETAANTAQGGFKKMTIALDETKESIGAALLPIFEKMSGMFANFAMWAQENTGLIVGIGTAIAGIAAAIITVNVAMKIWTATTKAFTAVQAAFNAVMAMNPLFLAVAAFVAVGVALFVLQKKFDIFGKALEFIGDIASSVWEGMKTGFGGVVSFVEGYVNTLLGIYKGLFNAIATVWNNTIGKLSFKIPGWVPGLGGKGFDVPDIPMLANGGIVSSPTLAMIGERGPEAVVPLTGNNTPGMGNNITINVNGGDPNAVVAALRNYMRQNGAIPIRITNP